MSDDATMNGGPSPPPGFWTGRPTLVTGASGLVGCWTVRQLIDEGADVVCWMRRSVDKLERLLTAEQMRQCTVVLGDIRDRDLLGRVLGEHRIATVLHLAAQTLGSAAFNDPVATLESNVAGTWDVLDACRQSATTEEVVVASSYNAYGTQDRLPYHEEMPLRGRLPYDVSKACADLVCGAYAATYGLEVGTTRCGNIYGGGDPDWKYIVPGTIRSILNGEPPEIRSHGRFVRDYLYVEDAARAHLLLAERLAADPDVAGEAFNFSNEEPLSVVELVRRILRLMGSSLEPVVQSQSVDEDLEKYSSAEKARRILGWQPLFDLDAGLRRTIDWYRKEKSCRRGDL